MIGKTTHGMSVWICLTQMKKVEKSAKLDKLVFDGLKNARKSDNEELSQLAHQAVDIIMANSKVMQREIISPIPKYCLVINLQRCVTTVHKHFNSSYHVNLYDFTGPRKVADS